LRRGRENRTRPSRVLRPLKRFYKDLSSLPNDLQDKVWEKLALFVEDPQHPSLGVHKIKGTENIWELSVTRSVRITYTPEYTKNEVVYHLRRVGFHDILRSP
jgi:mRNA-degrading endonuclease YafQ of YafQ-DinJ toxin-antitoxin module